MTVSNRIKAGIDWMEYAIKRSLLTVLGPASQEGEADPIERLKRKRRRGGNSR